MCGRGTDERSTPELRAGQDIILRRDSRLKHRNKILLAPNDRGGNAGSHWLLQYRFRAPEMPTPCTLVRPYDFTDYLQVLNLIGLGCTALFQAARCTAFTCVTIHNIPTHHPLCSVYVRSIGYSTVSKRSPPRSSPVQMYLYQGLPFIRAKKGRLTCNASIRIPATARRGRPKSDLILPLRLMRFTTRFRSSASLYVAYSNPFGGGGGEVFEVMMACLGGYDGMFSEAAMRCFRRP